MAWPKYEPRGNQLVEMIPECPQLVKPLGHKMQQRAKRGGNGLSFIVIVETGEIPPAGIAAKLDQARPEHDSEDQPSEQPDHWHWRRPFWERPAGQYRTTKKNAHT